MALNAWQGASTLSNETGTWCNTGNPGGPGSKFSLQTGSPTVHPGAAASLVSIALPAGNFVVSWSAILTVAAASSSNFGLYNASTLVATSVNGTSAAAYPQAPVTVVIASGGATLAVKAIASDASGTYNASFSASPPPVAVQDYPFTDPTFQNFTAQQYAGWTGSGANVAPIYT